MRHGKMRSDEPPRPRCRIRSRQHEEVGVGVGRDYVSAYVWFNAAAGQAPLKDNRKQLIELRDIAAVRMTPAQLVQAKRRITEWRPPGTR